MADATNHVNFDKVLDHVLDEIADQVFAQSQLYLVAHDKVDTGFLMKTGNVQREFLAKRVNYSAPYASYVHAGRLPGTMPPLGALEEWARRKLGLSRKEARSAAWAIGMAIKARGIRPAPFLEEGFYSLKGKVIRVQVSA
jgi:hypothetical protein